jgi:hypothetical protein
MRAFDPRDRKYDGNRQRGGSGLAFRHDFLSNGIGQNG